MVLLHLLVREARRSKKRAAAGESVEQWRLIVAHYDHGMREDSRADRQFVETVTKDYGLPFVFDQGNLGAGASEDTARQARYKFLHHVKEIAGAQAIITAHHQDDMLETAIINLLRGTGRRGLTALKSTETLLRPLLHAPKHSIVAYAKAYGVKWRDDPTNDDIKYLRNYVRHKILPEFGADDRAKLLDHITTLAKLNDDIDKALVDHLHVHPGTHILDRHWFIMLPHAVARDTMASWLRLRGVQNIDSRRLERLLIAAKTLAPGKQADVGEGHTLVVRQKQLALMAIER